MAQTLIIVSSITGNTWNVGRHLAAAHPEAVLLRAEEAGKNPAVIVRFLNVILGFWFDHKSLPPDIEALKPFLHDKTLGVFATMGGDPGSEKALAAFASHCNGLVGENKNNHLRATYLCRGRLSPMYLKHPAHNTPEGIAKYESSQSHPDAEDLQKALEAFKDYF